VQDQILAGLDPAVDRDDALDPRGGGLGSSFAE